MATGGTEPILQHAAPPAYSAPPAGKAPGHHQYAPGFSMRLRSLHFVIYHILLQHSIGFTFITSLTLKVNSVVRTFRVVLILFNP